MNSVRDKAVNKKQNQQPTKEPKDNELSDINPSNNSPIDIQRFKFQDLSSNSFALTPARANNENGEIIKSLTPSINKNFIDLKEYKRILKLLVKKYPVTFSYGSDIKILAIGIHSSMIKAAEELEVYGMLIRKFLHKYTKTKQYKEALQVGAKRYDLEGTVIGVVTENEITGPRNKDVALSS